MTLHELADELIEIRRYVRSKPEYVRERIMLPVNHSNRVDTASFYRFQELRRNICVGLDRIMFDPEILEGYLYGAAAEIREMDGKEEPTP